MTGATAGVGRATAVALAHEGFDVALLARGHAGLDAAAKDVEHAQRRALAVPVDVSDHRAVRDAAARVERELGPIDVWVNNAMTTTFSPVSETAADDFRRAVEVTFLGQVWGTMAALEHMRPRDRGRIVNVGSALAFIGIPLQAAYCSAKFACRGFFESTRAELIHDGSHVELCMVHLPAVNTPQFDWCHTTMDHDPQPVPPIYQPEVAARAIVASALDGRRSRVVGSWNKLLVVTGQIMPGVGDQYAARGAWESQLSDRKIPPGRAGNLTEAQDEVVPAGAHGRFDDRAHGFIDPSFLRSLPNAVRTFAAAAGASVRDHLRSRARR